MINLQIVMSANRKSAGSTNTAQPCPKTVLRDVYLNRFLNHVQIWDHCMLCHICKEKKYVLAEVSSPRITEKIGSKDRKSAKCHICRRSENLTNYLSPQICGLRFAELICGPPTSGFLFNRRFTLLPPLYTVGAAPESQAGGNTCQFNQVGYWSKFLQL
jgi:hypothetical protein